MQTGHAIPDSAFSFCCMEVVVDMEIIKTINEKKFPIAVHFVALSFIGVAIFLNFVRTPLDSKNAVPVTIQIPKGSSFAKIADILNQSGLVEHKLPFHLFARLKDAPTHIRAGEYELTSAMSPSVILDKMIRGEIKGYNIPVPEGFSMRQIASALAEQGLVDKKEFLKLCSDTAFLSSLGISQATAEGYLFPETYILTKAMDEKEIIMLMVEQLWKKITPDMVKRAQEIGFSLGQVLTVASMIEKEAKLKEEKPLIAAVFYNRLKISMRLQSDPTAVYGIPTFSGTITREHLKKETPYNTYQINGLPPGPIASPGLDSILAALYPAQVDYLYFVARNDGSHQFSTTLTKHNAAVARYQLKREEH